jgi:hypothetical protein
MDRNKPRKLSRNDPVWDVPADIENSVRKARKARGLKNPEDYNADTPEHDRTVEAFMLDVLAALDDAEDPSEDEAG